MISLSEKLLKLNKEYDRLQKISVSTSRKKLYLSKVLDKEYKFYSVYYPIGNGIFNIDKSIEDILWIIDNELKKEGVNNVY